jgi:tRNA(Ile)-lysidine synthase
MLNKVIKHIEDNGLLTPGETVICGVSGGIDSMVMQHILRRLGYEVIITQIDHGLRGVESKADQDMVRSYANEHQIEFLPHTLQLSEHPKDERSTQMLAREYRYKWFDRLLTDHPDAKLATAHHADDVVETMLFGIIKGVGVSGLNGIPVRSGRIIRPLLALNKEDVLQYANAEKIPFREDSSNQDPKYLRNRIRHELVPLMTDLAGGTARPLRRYAELMRSVGDALQSAYHIACIEDDEVLWWRTDAFKAPQSVLQLNATLRTYGVHPDQVARIAEAIMKGEQGKRYTCSDMELILDKGRLVIRPLRKNRERCLTIEDIHAADNKHIRSTIIPAGSVEDPTDTRFAFFDAEKVKGKALLRTWRPGDRMKPFGMEGSKLVSDMLNERGLSILEKEQVQVLVFQNEIIWLAGHRIAAGTGMTSGTKTVLCVRYLPNERWQESKRDINSLESLGNDERTFTLD